MICPLLWKMISQSKYGQSGREKGVRHWHQIYDSSVGHESGSSEDLTGSLLKEKTFRTSVFCERSLLHRNPDYGWFKCDARTGIFLRVPGCMSHLMGRRHLPALSLPWGPGGLLLTLNERLWASIWVIFSITCETFGFDFVIYHDFWHKWMLLGFPSKQIPEIELWIERIHDFFGWFLLVFQCFHVIQGLE